MGSIWHALAGLSGASAVGMGAYGAHGFKPVDKYYTLVFERANQYHFMGSFLLALAPMMKRSNAIGSLAAAGLLGFSGSCYAVALTEDRSVGKMAPFG